LPSVCFVMLLTARGKGPAVSRGCKCGEWQFRRVRFVIGATMRSASLIGVAKKRRQSRRADSFDKAQKAEESGCSARPPSLIASETREFEWQGRSTDKIECWAQTVLGSGVWSLDSNTVLRQVRSCPAGFPPERVAGWSKRPLSLSLSRSGCLRGETTRRGGPV
jgi:hypothetical protein